MLKYLFFTGGAGVQKDVRNETMNKRIIALGFLAKVLRAMPLRFPNCVKGDIMTESKVLVARSRVDWFNVDVNMAASVEIVGIGSYG